MSFLPTIPQFRPDLVSAAFPTNGQTNSWRPADQPSSMKTKDPLYYTILVDKYTNKYTKKPGVKKHLHQMGFIAVDGTVYPTREEQIEANRINYLYKQREEKLRKLHMREQSHLHHLRKAAQAGEVIFTKDGVFENIPCEECEVYHQVTPRLAMNTDPPCPSSIIGKRKAKEKEKENKRLLNRRPSRNKVSGSIQTSHVGTGHYGLDVATQTSNRRLPDISTRTSQRVLPQVGVQTSFVSRPAEVVKEPDSVHASQCQSNWSEQCNASISSAASYSSCTEENEILKTLFYRAVAENKQVDEAVIAQALTFEEEALRERLQEEIELTNAAFRKVEKKQADEALLVDTAQKELDQCKKAHSVEVKRNIALKAILKSLTNEQQRVQTSVEKQKAAKQLREEQHKNNDLIEKQIKLKMKKRLEKELEEKHRMLTETSIELADLIEAKRETERALAKKQGILARSNKQKQEVRHYLPHRPGSRLGRRQSPQQVSESSFSSFSPMNHTKQNVTHALGVIEQIKSDMSHLLPEVGKVLKERTSSYSQRHTSSNRFQASVEEQRLDNSCSSLWSEALTVDNNYENELRSSISTPVCGTQVEDHKKPSPVSCEARINNPNTISQERSFPRPSSIECTSSEGLRIDEGRIDKPALKKELQTNELSCFADVAHQYDSASTLGILSTRWSTLQQAGSDSLPTKEGNSTLGCHSERQSELNPVIQGCQQEEPSPQSSFDRVPTPPVYPKPPGRQAKDMISCLSSLRQISENRSSDFSKEFESPLPVHSAVVPYYSLKARLGLKNTEATSSKQKHHYGERQKGSRTDLAEKEEAEIRNSLLNLLPPKRTLDEYYAAEAEDNTVPTPTPVVSSTPSETQLNTEKELSKRADTSRSCSHTFEHKKDDGKSISDEYSATCLQETSSTYMFSAGSAKLAKINASIARLRVQTEKENECVVPGSGASLKDTTAANEVAPSSSSASTRSSRKGSGASLKDTVAANKVAPSSSRASNRSSRKGSAASLKDAAVANEVAPSSNCTSTRSSRKGSAASLKDVVQKEISIPQRSSNTSTKSNTSLKSTNKLSRPSSSSPKKVSIPLIATQDISSMTKSESRIASNKSSATERAETETVPELEVVADKHVSCKSVTELSVQTKSPSSKPALTELEKVASSLDDTVSPSGDTLKNHSNTSFVARKSSTSGTQTKMTSGEVAATVKSPTGSRKSLSSLKTSLKSLLLPSQMSAKLSKKTSQSSSDGATKVSPKASTSSVHSA